MCLLLALGDKLETPFRIFDEFDVFLDAQARKLVMQQMLYMAKKLENRQFIFITPQDLSSVKFDDKLKIYKLQPPVRSDPARIVWTGQKPCINTFRRTLGTAQCGR